MKLSIKQTAAILIILLFVILFPPWELKCRLPENANDYFSTGSICYQRATLRAFINWGFILNKVEIPSNHPQLVLEKEILSGAPFNPTYYVGLSYDILIIELILICFIAIRMNGYVRR